MWLFGGSSAEQEAQQPKYESTAGPSSELVQTRLPAGPLSYEFPPVPSKAQQDRLRELGVQQARAASAREQSARYIAHTLSLRHHVQALKDQLRCACTAS